MNKRALLILAVILLVIAILVFVILPMETKAPTFAPGTAATSTTSVPTPSPSPISNKPATLPDLITVLAPLPNEKIASPLTISGQARGNWYFEGSAPVILQDASGTVVGHGVLKAQGSWTTTNFVPFVATLTFTSPATHTGTLILKNDNPSGDPKRQKTLEIPVEF